MGVVVEQVVKGRELNPIGGGWCNSMAWREGLWRAALRACTRERGARP